MTMDKGGSSGSLPRDQKVRAGTAVLWQVKDSGMIGYGSDRRGWPIEECRAVFLLWARYIER
jgi:hypothetical protein